MTRRVAVLRPEPANAATVEALERVGIEAIALPLFEVAPLPWIAPVPSAHDGLLLTSANAIRHAGAGLAGLGRLPVFAVGTATAQAAERAGLRVVATGSEGATAITAIAVDRGHRRLLHLAGRNHAPTPLGVTTVITVYESRELPVSDDVLRAIEHGVALLHSPRAAQRLAALATQIDRSTVRLGALSPLIAEAAGSGWAEVAVAETRDNAALVALAARLAD